MLVKMDCENGGGVTLEPQISNHYTLNAGGSQTVSIDTSKKYIIVGTLRYSDNTYRTFVHYFDGTLQNLATTAWIACAYSNGQLTFTANSGAGAYSDFTIIQLD